MAGPSAEAAANGADSPLARSGANRGTRSSSGFGIIRSVALFTGGMLFASLTGSFSLLGRIDVGPHVFSLEKEVLVDRLSAVPSNASSASESSLEKEMLVDRLSAIPGNASNASGSSQPQGDTNESDGICSRFPMPTPTSLALWSSHLPHIFQSSQHPIDRDFDMHDLTALLLHRMTPDRIQRSVKTLPLDMSQVGRVLDIAYQRWNFLKQHGGKAKAAPSPLNILVLGGSVTMGVLCHTNPATKKVGKYSRRACAWPARLEAFLNGVLGADVVSVKTVTLGGTNTESGITLWDYGLFPDDVPYPDILINAYATNDMHVGSMEAAAARNETHSSRLWDLTQRFIRTVLQPVGDKCDSRRPPLLIYFDDYVGNEQNVILETAAVSRTLHTLATYYGIAHISYADAIRDMVYGDTAEEWFSPWGWFDKNGKFTRQIHPGMAMHITSCWVVAFNLLNMITTYCSLAPAGRHVANPRQYNNQNLTEGNEKEWENFNYGYEPTRGLPKLKQGKFLRGGPRPRPEGLPPELNGNLMLDSITQRWKAAAPRIGASAGCGEGIRPGNGKPCAFSWVAGIGKDYSSPEKLDVYMKRHLTHNRGWAGQSDNGKLGYVARGGLHSKFTLELSQLHLARPVRSVTFMVIQSYGDKWAGSKVNVVASGKTAGLDKESRLGGMEIYGFHKKQTSEVYNFKMELTNGEIDGLSSLKVEVELTGGSTFKITGMAFCYH